MPGFETPQELRLQTKIDELNEIIRHAYKIHEFVVKSHPGILTQEVRNQFLTGLNTVIQRIYNSRAAFRANLTRIEKKRVETPKPS